MNNFKKILATGAAVAALLINTGVVYAGSSADASVGEDGDAYVYSEDNDEIKVEVKNKKADLENLDMGMGLTGGNFQYGNDDDGEILTGDAEGAGMSENFLNTTQGSIEDSEDSADAVAEVGDDGFAEAYAYDNDLIEVLIENIAGVDNASVGMAVSGHNFQFCNDDNNIIDTGDSEATAKALNELNTTWVYIGGSHTASAEATVGEDGDAYAWAEDNDKYKVNIRNDAELENLSLAMAVSGFNGQFGNDDDNEITTGMASASSSASNFLNTNVIVIGDLGGGATATSHVGDDTSLGACGECGDSCHKDKCLSSEAYAEDNDTVTVKVDNDADVSNTSVAVGISGGNIQSGNDDGGSIDTGDASGVSCSTNVVNTTMFTIGDGEMPDGGTNPCD